jgi:hypothetical protein
MSTTTTSRFKTFEIQPVNGDFIFTPNGKSYHYAEINGHMVTKYYSEPSLLLIERFLYPERFKLTL